MRWRIKIVPTQKQKRFIFNAKSRLNLLTGAVRSSKSVAANLWFLNFMSSRAPKDGNFVFTGYSNTTIFRNVIYPMQQLVGPDLKYRSSNDPHCMLWGRRIDCVGFKDISAIGKIQGAEFAGGLHDELPRHNHEAWKMLDTRFSIEGAERAGTANPEGPYHWAKELIDNEERDIWHDTFTLDDNPHLPPDYVEDLKKSYTGAFYKRNILGIWCQAEGAIYDFYEDEYPYVITDEQTPEADYYVLGIDHGFKNPFAAGLVGVRKSNKGELKAWLHREYYYDGRKEMRMKTDDEYFNDLVEFIKPVNKPILGAYIDPSATSLISVIEDKRYKGVPFPPVMETDNSVLDGISTVGRMWKGGMFAVNKSCVNTRKEAPSYVWDEKAQLRGEDKPLKENDHCMDGPVRYPLHSIFGNYSVDYEAFTRW